MQEILNLAIKYDNALQQEDELPPEKLAVSNMSSKPQGSILKNTSLTDVLQHGLDLEYHACIVVFLILY